MSRRFRTASSVVAWFDGHGVMVANYRARRHLRCSPEWIGVLAAASAPVAHGVLVARIAALGAADPEKSLSRLHELGLLVACGTPQDEDDRLWRGAWKWGACAGWFHHQALVSRWATREEDDRLMTAALAETPIPLWSVPDAGRERVELAEVDRTFFAGLARSRRTCRDFAAEGAVPVDDLAFCLWAGLGFRGSFSRPLRGELPLTLTPSAGSRNPFEGFVLARQVTGLPAGAYHYVGREHCLQPVGRWREPSFGRLLGGQDWADAAAALIVLVAHLDRPMGRYRRPGDYRNVLIEAGHIGQNILLAATEAGLASAPVSAVDHLLIEHALGVGGPLRSAMYAVLLGAGASAG